MPKHIVCLHGGRSPQLGQESAAQAATALVKEMADSDSGCCDIGQESAAQAATASAKAMADSDSGCSNGCRKTTHNTKTKSSK